MAEDDSRAEPGPRDRAKAPHAFAALRGIEKRYGAFTANDRIDLSIDAGEIHALLGENGAGKSTLMKILCGLVAPDAGDILIDGEKRVFADPAAARTAGIAMVFQHFALFEALSVVENIALALPKKRAGPSLRNALIALEARFGLGVDLDRKVFTLSAGERQRVEILRALSVAPRLLILDEPTSVLTPAEAEMLFGTLEKLAAEGTAILFISHKLAEVRRLCHRATVLRAGRVVGTADPRQVSAAELAGMMVGEASNSEGAMAPRGAVGANMLALRGICCDPAKARGGIGLHDVDLTVQAGEIVAIVGVAGNGQGALFGVISGEDGPPDGGALALCGQEAGDSGITARRRLGAAFVPEDRLGHGAVPGFTLGENVLLTLHGVAPLAAPFIRHGTLKARAAAIVVENDVRVPAENPRANQLSGGNLQKFIIGREIGRAPRLLVVDQPSWGVDVKASAAIRERLRQLAEAGTAVLVITQDLDEAFEIGTRIAVLHHGRLSPPVPAATADRAMIGLLMTDRDSHDAARADQTTAGHAENRR